MKCLRRHARPGSRAGVLATVIPLIWLATSDRVLAQTPVVPSTTLGQQQPGGTVYPSVPAGTTTQQRGAQAENPFVLPAGTRLVGCPQPLAHITPGSTVSSGDWVELERNGCAGACADYRVRLNANGTVEWHGMAQVLVARSATGQVDAAQVANLIQHMRDHGFEALCQRYTRQGLEAPWTATRISVAGVVHEVRDDSDSAPAWIRDFDADIDGTADTHRWRHGDPARELFGAGHLSADARLPKPGRTQLMRAAGGQGVGAMRLLLGQNAVVDQADASGWTALMYAAGAGTLAQVQVLLDAGADAGRRSAAGENALFAAVASTDNPVAKLRLLARAGAGVTTARSDGTSVLMLAADAYPSGDLLRTVLSLGADPSVRDAQGRTAIDRLDAARAALGEASTADRYQAARALLVRPR